MSSRWRGELRISLAVGRTLIGMSRVMLSARSRLREWPGLRLATATAITPVQLSR